MGEADGCGDDGWEAETKNAKYGEKIEHIVYWYWSFYLHHFSDDVLKPSRVDYQVDWISYITNRQRSARWYHGDGRIGVVLFPKYMDRWN